MTENSVSVSVMEDSVMDLKIDGLVRVDKTLNEKDLKTIMIMGRNLSSPSTIAQAIGLLEADLYTEANATLFKTFYHKARALGMACVQEAQFKVAIEDQNPQMLIHLGKAYLGQNETVHINQTVTEIKNMSLDEIAKKLVQE